MSEEVMKTDGCFDTMTTQQLEELLRADAEGTGNLDTDSLFYIMELLAARQETEGRSAAQAYAEFCEDYMPRKEKKGKCTLQGKGILCIMGQRRSELLYLPEIIEQNHYKSEGKRGQEQEDGKICWRPSEVCMELHFC